MSSDDDKRNGNGGAQQAGKPEAAYTVQLPEQKGFFRIPARFGHVPVAEEPLGYDRERRFEGHYPRIELPFQLVDVVETAAKKRYETSELFPNGLNRLFFGDCLHVMRMLPSESIDLIYIDPPFFSGRNYNIIFGDKNEVRSFSDIWEGGMPGYLIWLNARLYEMKRLLKPTGSIYVHLDWHAVHYVKCEMDRIFGYDCFRNEIVWRRSQTRSSISKIFKRAHDTLFLYTKSPDYTFEMQFKGLSDASKDLYTKEDERGLHRLVPLIVSGRRNGETGKAWRGIDPNTCGKSGSHWVTKPSKLEEYDRQGLIVWPKKEGGLPQLKYYLEENKGVPVTDLWDDIDLIPSSSAEAIGYPTQKPEALLERIISASSNGNDVVADFFCGGGTTVAVAQKLGRRWIGCDISRVAVALTADRIARILAPNIEEVKRAAKRTKVQDKGTLFESVVRDVAADYTLTSVEEAKKRAVERSWATETGYTVEHWGIYEINRLTKLFREEFRAFVLACYGARKWTGTDPNIHGVKAKELLWVAGPRETDVVMATDVRDFAQAVMKSRKPEDRQAVMIGWGIDPKARSYAEQVMALGEQRPIQFIKLRLWPVAGEEFKAHVTKRHDKYKDFFAFILPPDIPRIGVTRVGPMAYRFDVSEARSMNTGGKIVNAQWDFDFRDGIFSATQGYQLCRKERKGRGEDGFEGEMTVEYRFEDMEPGTEVMIACRVQDDLGGEGMKSLKLKVE